MCGECFGIDLGDNLVDCSCCEVDMPSSRRLFFLSVLSNKSDSFLLRNDDPNKLGLSLSLLKKYQNVKMSYRLLCTKNRWQAQVPLIELQKKKQQVKLGFHKDNIKHKVTIFH